ncbi:SDR family NAD(P)-dependent oxidoreductase [Pontibacillus yanchengensis]|uniref:SDR family NAD(P)-dependent oxidoreductase n=2 Tax=Pontibacillus yanchengensis TaxID=462910 RepID=A0ACC7VJC4_9BACI|nr:SDR family oxidoreductase [Pontibacillus yanchengensis]MYL35278.1 SDR family NAD(P)-dependent oxidoreductase [Pontibacillus yanchengensis]MYL54888.1 SDR family NAD(P)-dependent oxidoreductase [Pontibacillus yanchengensis]
MAYVGITGASSGLGAELAKAYAANHHHIYLLGRNEDRLLIIQREIQDAGGQADIIVCDVTEPSSVNEGMQQIDQLDILINNAGIGIFGPVVELDSPDITQMLNTNVKGTIYMTQAALPLLEENGGRVLNIISTAGLRGKVNESVYCASKFAQRGFTESLQKEYENTNIQFTAVYMGGMNTPFWDQSDHVENPSKMKNPAEVAAAIVESDDGRKEIYIDK